jgi:hypothetical protein
MAITTGQVVHCERLTTAQGWSVHRFWANRRNGPQFDGVSGSFPSARAGQPTRTDVIVTSVTGSPSRAPPTTPAAATLSSVVRPVASMLPNTV